MGKLTKRAMQILNHHDDRITMAIGADAACEQNELLKEQNRLLMEQNKELQSLLRQQTQILEKLMLRVEHIYRVTRDTYLRNYGGKPDYADPSMMKYNHQQDVQKLRAKHLQEDNPAPANVSHGRDYDY